MVERPGETVTFLFTDIEGSTRLLQELGDVRYAEALEEHRRILRAAFAAHEGLEIDTQGDSFFVTFPRARDALLASGLGQSALAAHAWPQNRQLRVRMGIHTGEATHVAGGWVGVGVHRGARVCAAGHGGQVLVSHTTRRLVETDEAGFVFKDLGVHRLKDLTEAHPLFQLVVAGLPDEFPPLRTLENRPTNLPVQQTPFVGRSRDIERVTELLRQRDVRAITLTGPGGTGKTRLALQAAAELLEEFPNGVFFVTLAAISDPELVLPQIAQTLGVNETAGQELMPYLADKQILLVIDNVEQVLGAADHLAQLLSATRSVKLLCTSRESLRISAEQVYPVPPLDVPDPARLPDYQALSQYAAIELFVQRARAVAPQFAVTASNAPAIAEICVELDGLPLAIELAAVRIAVLSPEDMLARLGERLKLLRGGPRDAPERQRTISRTLEWSYDLLSADEQTLFARLAVFSGGFSLAAAEEVCDADLDDLGSLVSKSLVRRDDQRFTMLQVIREYARDRLQTAGEATMLRERQADYFESLVSAAFVKRFEREAERADELEAEHDNIRAALGHLADTDPPRRLRMAGMLGWFWRAHSHLSEGRSQLEAALEASGDDGEDRARALGAAGALAGYQGDLAVAKAHVEEAVSTWRAMGAQQDVAGALFDLGWAYFFGGNNGAARRSMEDCLRLQLELGNPGLINRAQLGLLQMLVADGELDGVPALVDEALQLSRELGDTWAEHFGYHFLADMELMNGQFKTAAHWYGLSLRAAARSGDEVETCFELQGMGMSLAGLGESELSLRIASAAAAQLTALGVQDSVQFWDDLLERFTDMARDALGDRAQAVWGEGRVLSLTDAVDAALSYGEAEGTADTATASGSDAHTAGEAPS